MKPENSENDENTRRDIAGENFITTGEALWETIHGKVCQICQPWTNSHILCCQSYSEFHYFQPVVFAHHIKAAQN